MKRIYIDEIEDKCNELMTYSKKDIASEIEVLKNLPNQFVWQGLSNEKYVNLYNKKVQKLMILNSNMCKIAEFLSRVSEDYNNANDKVNNAYEELLSSFERVG